jgi:two-component system chemotaxis sensor kinase CheA
MKLDIKNLKSKMLIVDDEADLREIMAEIASTMDIPSATFASADEALAAAGPFDQYFMVLSDFKMPGKNGVQFCQAIREQGFDTPFVILTGFADKQMVIQGLNAGITELLEKPIHTDALEKVIEKHAESYIAKQKAKEDENKELIGFFVDETKELYSDLEETLLRLKEVPLDPVVIDVVFRKIHSVKGGASAIPGAELLAKLSHEFESRLSFIKNNRYQPHQEEIPVYLDAAALSLKIAEALKTSTEEVNTYSDAVDHTIQLFLNLPKESALVETIELGTPAATIGLAKGLEDDGSFHEEEIMVKNSQLDHFMKLAGELVILKNYYQSLVQDLSKTSMNTKIFARVENFSRSMEKSTQALQDHILEVRKVSLKKISAKLSRITRQTSKSLNKKINFEVIGHDLKVDKSIATAIGASLTHMVRNSMDHGIEVPEERIKVGKSEVGSVKIEFKEDKGAIEVWVSDDGRGLNLRKIKEKALEKKLITELQAENMNDIQIADMIFLPGFSTADQVTDVSGRGVGMDAALNMVQQLDGYVRIESTSNKGSIFKIRIPFLQTVSVEKSLIVQSDSMMLAVPIDSVRQIMKGREGHFVDLHGQMLLVTADGNIPLIGFSQSMGAHTSLSKEFAEQNMILTIKAGHHNFAMVVDQVHQQSEAVTQALPPAVMKEAYVLGTTILGDDQIAYVLDPEILYIATLMPEKLQMMLSLEAA